MTDSGDRKDSAKERIELELLGLLAKDPRAVSNSLEYLKKAGLDDHELLVGVLKSLEQGQYVALSPSTVEQWSLTDEGKRYLEKGSPEFVTFSAIPTDGIERAALEGKVGKDMFQIGFAQCMKQKWIELDKASGKVLRKVEKVEDKTKSVLAAVNSKNTSGVPADVLSEFSKRKLAFFSSMTVYAVAPGAKFATQRRVEFKDLTAEMVRSGEWAGKDVKPYNWNALGTPVECGALHPLMKVRAQFRSTLLEMGFSEMPTNNFVESSFWNFDALFQPQQHPARDSHDTFFVKSPATTLDIPAEYMEKVKTIHEKGGFGSIGYRYDWKEEEARKNILRTHTTAVSTRMLHALAEEKEFRPAKYFSIDRVFRNETLDYTHLCEFHQVEGLIADRNLTLGDLIGTIKTFFSKIDITDVRFKPAYNPYTEPSMEIFGFSKELNKWIEVGNSGIFRPEMLLPMGLPEDVRVIAWGLSLERPTMIKYGIKNIRDLFGHKVKLDLIASNPIARYDMDPAEPRWRQAIERKGGASSASAAAAAPGKDSSAAAAAAAGKNAKLETKETKQEPKQETKQENKQSAKQQSGKQKPKKG